MCIYVDLCDEIVPNGRSYCRLFLNYISSLENLLNACDTTTNVTKIGVERIIQYIISASGLLMIVRLILHHDCIIHSSLLQLHDTVRLCVPTNLT